MKRTPLKVIGTRSRLVFGLLFACSGGIAGVGSATEPVLPGPAAFASPCDFPFAGQAELSVEAVVEQVLLRNPSLAEMSAAWAAASARYPQVTSLDDPMFRANFAPAAMGGLPDGSSGYDFELSQKYPWPGKLHLRGDKALALAQAAGNDVEDLRLRLIEAAKTAFFDYYLVFRAIDVNSENLRLLREFRQNAETRYRTGLVPQQDVLQADVEIGRAQERQLNLERIRQVAVARINTLMHWPPDVPLPPPPGTVRVADSLPAAPLLRDLALSRRPDLLALMNRIRAEEAALRLAYKEYCPDLEPMIAYDNFWSNREQQYQIGLRLNLPLRCARRKGAVDEAQARIAERQAELARQTDQVNFEVQQAYEQVHESEQAMTLYEQRIVPAAQANVKAAQAAYVTGTIPFLSLIEAERNVVGIRDRSYEVIADYFRRRATLERVVGGPLVPGSPPAGCAMPQ